MWHLRRHGDAMNDEVLGSWGELQALRSTLEGGAEDTQLPVERTQMRRHLFELLLVPGNREALRRQVDLDPAGPRRPRDEGEIVGFLARRMKHHHLRLTEPTRGEWWRAQFLPSP